MDGPECVLGWGAVDDEGGTGTPDGPKWTARETRWKEVLWITWFCLYLSLYLYPYPQFVGSQGDWHQGVCPYLSVCLCLYLCPFLCPFLCPWEGLRLGGGSRRHNQRASHQEGLGECGYVIPRGGEVVRLRRERACCPRGLAQARGRREEGGHPEMVVVSGSCCNS